eukprot:TRINITY_DN2366_c0_g1_i1.p1 TRINITY_DN2366_c0_g1~~TRINITY_DN2366_c0_g1_i1.p1  ORF type:complete len:367 (+),score=132.74 TRINITY_DN2366_c0_g1_i1:378-1478(+)
MSSSLEEVPSSTAAASVVAPAPPAAASSLLPGNGSTENLSEEGGVPAPPSSSGVKEPSKEIIARNVRGTVKWFNVKSGYGFINRSDTKEDVFVHQTAIVRNNPKKAVRSVGDGEEVEFDVVVGEKGNEASNVSGPEGNCVKGSPYAADKRSRGGYRKIGRGYYPRRLPGRPLKDGEEGGHLLGAEDAKGSPPSRSMKLRYNGGGGGRPPMRRRGIHPGPTVGRPENNQGAQQQQPGNAGAPPNQQIEDDLLLLSAPDGEIPQGYHRGSYSRPPYRSRGTYRGGYNSGGSHYRGSPRGGFGGYRGGGGNGGNLNGSGPYRGSRGRGRPRSGRGGLRGAPSSSLRGQSQPGGEYETYAKGGGGPRSNV